jgi:PHD/YefM family antitoxin component YafN of YafNO toxin-antitoxin module
MPDLSERADAPANPKRSVLPLLEQLREDGQPIVVKINNQAELVVRDEASFNRLCELVDRLESIEAVQQGLEGVEHGRVRSLEAMIEDKRAKYDF